jgi:hypothetical protein
MTRSLGQALCCETALRAGECGGMIGGTSKEIRAELAAAQALFKATKLTFMVIAPV